MKKILLFLLLLSLPAAVFSYVGPGAGFAFVGSFLFIFLAFILAAVNLLTFPLRLLFRNLKKLLKKQKARFSRVLVIGFDGMDYNLLRHYLQDKSFRDHLPNFSALRDSGSFLPLLSSEPPISPVAWSTFATGVNPGKHNIFDFLATDRATYMPKLACSEILPGGKCLRFGKLQIPLPGGGIEAKRKSLSFWKTAAGHGVYSQVLRVPFTFPPESFYGTMLAGLGTPDLRGTQGSFTFFSTEAEKDSGISEGLIEKLEPGPDGSYRGRIRGPRNPFMTDQPLLYLPFQVSRDLQAGTATVILEDKQIVLRPGEFSAWMPLKFRTGLLSISGIAQWLLKDLDPLKIYLSPLNIDPEAPSMPVSQPKTFAAYLAKRLGPFATLGMAEDTWALNEGLLNEGEFLAQTWQMQQERENIFFDGLDKIKTGLLVAVFEATDRVQHMFWRDNGQDGSPLPGPEVFESYRRMDELLGRVLPRIKPDDLLLVVSDHGFSSFRREFHLNSWLKQEGYLVLKQGSTSSAKWYAEVDWSRSRAYGQGLNGIYLNLKNRERQGIVEPGAEAEKLKAEIRDKLLKLVDPETGMRPLRQVQAADRLYRGPYTGNAPDLVMGYERGFRVSWESSVNVVSDKIFTDNTRPWSGDHAFTRDQVPGILFCNRAVATADPGLIDIAPTVLSQFGIARPAYLEGRDLGIG